MNKRETLTEQLRTAIQESGRSQVELAQAAGISQGQLSRFMNGQRDLRLSSVERLASELGLTLRKS